MYIFIRERKLTIANTLAPYMQSLFGFLAVLHNDPEKSEDTLKSMVGIIGYIVSVYLI